MTQFAICTFCFGDRYHKQVNRMISEIELCQFHPPVVVVTDNVDNILDKPFVKKFDIQDNLAISGGYTRIPISLSKRYMEALDFLAKP